MYTAEKQTTSELIADAALAILESEGAAAVTMRRVAAAVSITPMAIYHHFPSREALLTAITDREFEKLAGYLAAVPETGSPESRFVNSSLAYLDYALDRPRVFEYVFSAARPGGTKVSNGLSRPQIAFHEPGCGRHSGCHDTRVSETRRRLGGCICHDVADARIYHAVPWRPH